MSDPIPALLAQAQIAIGTSQEGLGKLVGISRRTAQRWATGRTSPVGTQLHDLARAIHPHHRDLAEQFARLGGTTLVALGLERPPTPPPPKPLPPPPPAIVPQPHHLADSIVCVAAEALALPPSAIRPALLAAFERAREMGLSLEIAEAALRQPAPKLKAKPAAS